MSSEVSGCSDHIRTLPYSKQKLRQQVLHVHYTLTSNYNFLPIDVFTKPLQCFGKSVHVEGSMVVATSRLFYLLEEN